MADFNFDFKTRLGQVPDRRNKPRQDGLTMVMDKGLTLDQAKQFIESIGGTMQVTSFENKGTIFTLNIPTITKN